MTTTLRIPTVHLNGTSKPALLEQHLSAAQAVRAAQEALRQTAPNGRDYYVQNELGYAPIVDAQVQHNRRLELLAEVLAELMLIAEGIEDQS